MLKLFTVFLTCIALFGCGANPSINSDRPTGISIIDTAVPQLSTVQLVETGPTIVDGGVVVKGASCKNKIWQPKATKDVALNQLKLQAEELGLSKVHSVTYRAAGTSVVTNCWETIYAEGIAFNDN